MDRGGVGSEACEQEIIVGRTVLNFISAHVPQAGKHMPEKELFTLLGKIVSEIDDGEKLLICGDLNGPVGRKLRVSRVRVHGEFGFGKRNVEGEMILEFADTLNFAVAITRYKKNEGRLITYEIHRKCRTVIDYILFRKS